MKDVLLTLGLAGALAFLAGVGWAAGEYLMRWLLGGALAVLRELLAA